MFNPCPKPPPREKKAKTQLKAKNKDPIPSNVKKQVYERQEGRCRVCPFAIDSLHHIIKRSQASKAWKHDPRNLYGLCAEHHDLTEQPREFRRVLELLAVKEFGWLAGRPMTEKEWKEWRNQK